MRYIVLVASVLIQVCLGGLYAWSNFVPVLRDGHGLSTTQTQVIFGGLIAIFTFAMIPAGKLLSRRGPRLVAGIGGVLFGSGYLVASMSGGAFPLLFLGISVIAGAGTGFCYVCPLAVCARWFPARKGLVTGIAVAGFGGGLVVLASLAEWLLACGWGVLAIFRWVGLSYGAVIFAAALMLRLPPASRTVRVRSVPAIRALLQDPFFWGLWIGMFCGTFAGLLVIGIHKPLALAGGISPVLTAAALSALAAGNASGRIVWGWVADRLGPWSIPLALGFLAAALCLFSPVSISAAGLVAVSLLIGFGFGACFVIYAAQVGSRYGVDRVGSIYPLIFLGYGLSGIAGPFTGGWLHDLMGSYVPGIAVSAAVVLAGLLSSGWLLLKAKAISLRVGGKVPAASPRLSLHRSGG